jgi:hypothetical protein
MNKNLQNSLKSLSRAFSLVGVTLVISAAIFTLPAALAEFATTHPEWNSGTTANEQNWFQVSKGTDWSNTVAVNPGDLLSFQIYVHNNTCPANDASQNDQNQCPDTTATHTFVKVNLPANGGVVTATIGSDQASYNISKSLNITLPAGQTISYVSGTTVYRRHPISGAWVDLSTFQDFGGDNGITTTGQALGSIPGCYSQVVVVMFQARVTNVPTGTPKTPPVVKTAPNTGPEEAIQFALMGLIPAGVLLRRFRV